MTARTEGRARSIHVRLVRHAQERGLEPSLVFTRYATERLLYRLSVSGHGPRFVLKGAMLLLAWYGDAIRATRDADLLGRGELGPESLARLFREVCVQPVPDDGMAFDPDSVVVSAIRDDDAYGGQRVSLLGQLGAGRMKVQLDVGIGDAVYPAPEVVEIAGMLDLPPVRLSAYPAETIIAEKLHAMVLLGDANSRMKDFFDVHLLARSRPFDAGILAEAIRRTFERRRTPLPTAIPLALTAEFVSEAKQTQWEAFLRRAHADAPHRLRAVVDSLAAFLVPVLDHSADDRLWVPGQGWVEATRGKTPADSGSSAQG